MTPQEIGQWIAQHGGPDGGEGPDANGVIMNRAKDGSVLTVKRNTPNDFTEVSRQEAAPATAAPAPSASAASPAGGGTSVNEQDVLAQLATIAPGGDPSKLEYIESTEPRKVTRVPPNGIDPVEMTVSMPVRTWYDPSTGRAMKFDVGESGAFTRTFSGVDPNLKKQAAQATGQRTNIEGTPDTSKPSGFDNDRPIMVTRGADGTVIKSEPLTAPERAQWEKDTGRAQGQTARQEVPGHAGTYHVVSKDANGNTDDHYEDASGKTVPAPTEVKPGTLVDDGHGGKLMVTQDPATGKISTQPVQGVQGKPDQVTANGVVYERGPDGAYAPAKGLPTSRPGQMVDIDGRKFWASPNPDPSQPPTLTAMNPGAGTQPADNGPQFEPGMKSSDYLSARRQYWMDQRRAGVAQKDINDGWAQDVQIASQRGNEDSIAATQQNQRLSSAMSGFSQAATTAAEINRYVDPGSDLGGRAFEALLTLQRGQAQQMGAYGPMGGQPAPAYVPSISRTVTPAAPDPSTQVAAIPAAPVAGPIPGVRTGAAMTGGGVDAPVVRPAPVSAAAVAAPAAPVAPVAPDMNLPPGTPTAQAAGAGSRNLDTQPGAPMFASTELPSTPAADPLINVRNRKTGAWEQVTLSALNSKPDRADYDVSDPNGSGAVSPTAAPDYGQPGMTVIPQPSATPINLPGEPGYNPGIPQGMAPSRVIPVAAIPESPYDFAARIASTPPWQMDEATHNQAQAMGLGQQFWSVPGSSAA